MLPTFRLAFVNLHADGGDGPARVAMLLRQNPTAGRAFCASLCQNVPVERVADLIAALRDHLLSSAPAQGQVDIAAEAGPSKSSKRRRGRKQIRAADGSPNKDEEEAYEVIARVKGSTCASRHIVSSEACLCTAPYAALVQHA